MGRGEILRLNRRWHARILGHERRNGLVVWSKPGGDGGESLTPLERMVRWFVGRGWPRHRAEARARELLRKGA